MRGTHARGESFHYPGSKDTPRLHYAWGWYEAGAMREQDQDFWDHKELGYGFSWDGFSYSWSRPELDSLSQFALVGIGGALVLYGIAPSLLGSKLRRNATPARFQLSLLAGGAICSFLALLRFDEGFPVLPGFWLSLALLVVLARPSRSRRGAILVGTAELLALLVLAVILLLAGLPQDDPWAGAFLVTPLFLVTALVHLRRRLRPRSQEQESNHAWNAVGMLPAAMLAMLVAVEWFPFDPHHSGVLLAMLVTSPLTLGIWFAMVMLAIGEPWLLDRVDARPNGGPHSEAGQRGHGA